MGVMDDAEAATCTCGATASNAAGRRGAEDTKNYFLSQNYNAGRHDSTTSVHKAHCGLWRPQTKSHLHSWRRGFNETGKDKEKKNVSGVIARKGVDEVIEKEKTKGVRNKNVYSC